MSTAPHVVYEFGPFRVDPEREALLRDGEPLAVTPKVFEVLLTLLQHHDEVVAKDELLQAVWPGRVVEEANLSQCIFVLRKLLGEGHNQRRYIQTVSRKGYRFVAPVRTVVPDVPGAANVPESPHMPDVSNVSNVPDAPDAGSTVPADPPAVDAAPPAAPSAPRQHPRTRGWVLAAVAVLVVAVLALGTDWFMHRTPATTVATERSDPTPATVPKPFDPPADSLVVLPLLNLSGDPKQQYLSDGVTEDLTDTLGQNPALSVIAWATASRYRGADQDVARIGRQLNVAHLLNGSIQRMGDELRVTVELVDTRSGRQVWSQHYDGGLADIFKVQDQISAAIAGALKVKFASLGPARTVNPQAYDLVQQARALMTKGSMSAPPFERARTLSERAIALDPDYAAAHAEVAAAWLNLTQFSTQPLEDALSHARVEAGKALVLDPRNLTALMALASVDMYAGKTAEAKVGFERALATDPSSASAHLNYGNLLPLKPGLAQYLEAAQLNPGNATAWNNVAASELDLGEYAQALESALTSLRLDPGSASNVLTVAQIYALLHRDADAVHAFDLAKPTTPLAEAEIAAGRLTYQSLLDPKLHADALTAVDALADRADLDPFSIGNVLQLELALGRNADALGRLSKLCAGARVACNDLSVNPLWIPLRGDPRFKALVEQYDTVSKPAASAAPASPQ